MKKNTTPFLAFLLLTSILMSCNNNPPIKHFGKSVFSDFVNKDTLALKEKFYIDSVDTLVVKSYSDDIKTKNALLSKILPKTNDVIDPIKHNISKTFFNFKSLKQDYNNNHLWGKNLKYLETKADTSQGKYNDEITLNVYFSHEDTVFRLKVNGLVKLKSGWNFYSITNPVSKFDLLEMEQRKWRKDNLNRNIEIERGNYDYSNNRFENFHVTIANNTNSDFEKVQFRFSLIEGDQFSYKKIFSEDYLIDKGVESGDVLRHEIEDLREFYPGFKISDDDEWTFMGKIEKVEPSPVDTPNLCNINN